MRGTSRLIGLVLFLGTLGVFWPLGDAGFVNYDDPGYVYDNPHVVAGWTAEGAQWAFQSFHKANFHPLTWLSHMADVDLFGVAPGPHHLVNVLFHALNAVLLFGFLVRATSAPWPSAFAAALFALHPLHVESVAWISERKDVLSTFFWMLTLHAYLSWVRVGGVPRYLAVLALLLAGLLSKPLVVTLPCVLLLLDLWPLGRTPWVSGVRGEGAPLVAPSSPSRLLLEKLPMLALVLLASLVTLLAQDAGGAVVGTPALGVGARVVNAIIAYVWYLEKTILPTGLAVLYPHPYLLAGSTPAATAWLGPLWVLLGVTVVTLWQAVGRPYLLVGWLWFLGTLVPMIGLVQVGAQATADRYSYVPLIGLFVGVAWLGAEIAARARWRRLTVAGVAVLLLVLCLVGTRAQLSHWESARAMAARSIAVTQGNFVMHYNLGLALQGEGDFEGARRQYERAVALEPTNAKFHLNLAVVLVELGDYVDGIGRYRVAMILAPREGAAANNLAWLLATHPDGALRDGPESVRLARTALRWSGGQDAQALDTLAAAHAEAGDFIVAVRKARAAVRAARREGQPELARRVEGRLREYEAGRPHRERIRPRGGH
ncbi:MAG: tetratricopeptide repeat protein [Candidatus Binatia bacterium]|nr:tetratricopeptide repeat protein [Candidatus Binatia bacterium]